MTEKEQASRDIRLTFEFLHFLIDHPQLAREIPDKAEIEFVGPGLVQTETTPATDPDTSKILISTTRAFNILASQSPGPASVRE